MAIETISIRDAADVIRTVLADLIGTDYAQVLKVGWGADGTLNLVDAAGNALPITVVGTPAVTISGSPTVVASGTVAISGVPHVILDSGSLSGAIPTGANTIGSVGINAGSNLMGQVDLNSVPASARTTDSNAVAIATDAIANNLTMLTPKFAKANVATAQTDANVVTAVTSKKIRVLSFRLHVAGTAQTVTFNSKPAGAGVAISEAFACGANGGRSEAFNPVGHFETVTGEGLTVTTAAGGSTTGIGVVYVEV